MHSFRCIEVNLDSSNRLRMSLVIVMIDGPFSNINNAKNTQRTFHQESCSQEAHLETFLQVFLSAIVIDLEETEVNCFVPCNFIYLIVALQRRMLCTSKNIILKASFVSSNRVGIFPTEILLLRLCFLKVSVFLST